jgi:hypothetical protein
MALDEEYSNEILKELKSCLDHFLNNRGKNEAEDRLQERLLIMYTEDLKEVVAKCSQKKNWII